MTSPALRIVNAAGTLILDRNARSLNFLGKVAAGSGTTTAATGNISTTTGRLAGYTDYSFTSAVGTPVLAFVAVPAGRIVRCASQIVTGSTMDVRVYCGDDPNDVNGFQQQYQTDVYVFGLLSSATGVGLKLRDDAGNLTHVFTDTDGVPLYPRGRVTESGASIDVISTRTIPSLTKPAVCGFPNPTRITDQSLGGGQYRHTNWSYGWKWAGSTGLVLAEYRELVWTDDGPAPITSPAASESILIEAAAL